MLRFSATTKMSSPPTDLQNLPRMKSIWLDEDQEIEKLYSIQAEQFMNSGDHVDAMNITLLNSDVPKLENTENILLLPTKNPERIENSRSVSEEKKVKNSRKRKLFSFFKNINSRSVSYTHLDVYKRQVII